MDFIEFSVRDVLTKTFKPLAMRAQQKVLEVLVDIDAAMPDCLLGDPDRLGR